jgi:hypothetical protein
LLQEVSATCGTCKTEKGDFITALKTTKSNLGIFPKLDSSFNDKKMIPSDQLGQATNPVPECMKAGD